VSSEHQNSIEDERGTSRLEAFSDGVLAVSITLLVLNITVPAPDPRYTLQDALLKLWPNYLGYVTSFLVIGIIWVNHHHLFRYVKHTDQGLFLLNTLFLLCVGLIPFVTALVAEYLKRPGEHLAAIVYSGTLLLMSLSFNGLWWYAVTHPHLVDPRVDPGILRHLLKRSLVSIPFYLLSVVISLVSVEASLILYILITMFYALPIDRFLAKVRMREERSTLAKDRKSNIN
jgi:uncharacterized membrane protein